MFCLFGSLQLFEVPPGGSCVIRCREPFVGGASLATCTANNVDPSQEKTSRAMEPKAFLELF